MFPTINTVDENELTLEEQNKGTFKTISDSEKIYKTPNFDFEEKTTPLRNGDIDLIDDYQSIRNWIILFLRTPREQYKIYEGTDFGTSAYLLRGHKTINGLLYAQIKKEIEDGFQLNPNIQKVLDVQLSKNESILEIFVQVQLKDGYILENRTEVFKIQRG